MLGIDGIEKDGTAELERLRGLGRKDGTEKIADGRTGQENGPQRKSKRSSQT